MTRRAAASSRVARAPGRPARRAQLWGFPHAGAMASVYRAWEAKLALDVDVRSVELPGHGSRSGERPLTRARPLVELLASEMEPRLADRFALFGHSLGALLAFEVARELRRRGDREPAHLFVAGWPPPHEPPPTSDLLALDDQAFLAAVGSLGGIPAEALAEEELVQWLIGALRADYEVLETYEYSAEPPLRCGISVFLGSDDAPVDGTGWRRHTSGPFSVRLAGGDHFFVRSAEDFVVASVAEDLAAYVLDDEW